MALDKKNPKKKEGNDPRIRITKDGPYLVSGALPLEKEIVVADEEGVPVRWENAEAFPKQEGYALCRCGHSANKPYCTGKHSEVKFIGTETASKKKYLDQSDKISGPAVDLTDTVALCSAGRFCDKDKGTWEFTKDSANPKSKETAIQQACNCPSGRLVVRDKKTGKAIEPDFKQSISITEDPPARASGPIWVKGGVPVESADGSIYEVRNRVTLCRCGKSENKPFCDGTHLRIGFNDGDKRIKK